MEVFVLKIKPSFDNFLRSPNNVSLKEFQKSIESIDTSHLSLFQTYILVPLVMKIDDLSLITNKELIVELINTISILLKRTKIKDLNGLKTIIIVTLKEIHDFPTGITIAKSSEELKLSVIECITTALRNCYTDVLEKFYRIENCTIIGKIAATCVDLVEKQKYKKLRIAAVNCLEALFYVYEKADSNDLVLRKQIADLTFVFLPKISKVLFDCSMGDDKIGLNLISASVTTLGGIFFIVFADSPKSKERSYERSDFIKLVEKSKSKNSKENTNNDAIYDSTKKLNTEENFKNLVKNGRTSEWFRTSAKKLSPLIAKLASLRSNKSDLIRLNYAKICCTLAENCAENLQQENFIIFFESIIALSQDTQIDISELCSNSIRNLRQNEGDCKMNSLIQNLFEKHLTILPRIIERSDERDQISEFLFFKGFFRNLPKECLETIFISPGNLEKFALTLISAFDLELQPEVLREEYTLRAIAEDEVDNSLPWRKYKKVTSQRAVKHLEDLCQILGTLSVVQNFLDYFIELMKQNPYVSNECIMILVLMLAQERVEKKYIIQLLEELLEEKHWHLSLEPEKMKRLAVEKKSDWYIDRTPGLYESAIEIRVQDMNIDEDTESSADTINLTDLKFNILHTCLVLDAIGHISLQMKDEFKHFIFRSLHHILLKTSSSNYFVHNSGSFALNCIKTGLNLKQISDLIQQYSDYISYHLHILLKRTQQSELAVDILTVVLRYSTLNSLAYLETIISRITDDLSKEVKSSNISSYLRVCCVFLLNIQKWSSQNREALAEIPNDVINENKNFNEILLNSIRMAEVDDSPHEILDSAENIEDNEDARDTEEPKTSEEKIELPAYIQSVLKVLKGTLKLISSKNQVHQILSLECLTVGLPILIDYEDEILQLVHIIWYPFMERFTEKDPVVLNRCFTLLEVLAKCSKDFLLKSTLNDVLPFLNKFLQQASTNSIKEISLCQTQEFKLQSKLLENYPSLVINMNIRQKYFDDTLDAIILYLSKKQPKLLQENCMKGIIELSNYNKPLIYLKLLNYVNDSNYFENVGNIFEQIKINFVAKTR